MEEWYLCATCHKEIEEWQVQYYCKDSDTAWCSKHCAQIVQDFSFDQYGSWSDYQEYEG